MSVLWQTVTDTVKTLKTASLYVSVSIFHCTSVYLQAHTYAPTCQHKVFRDSDRLNRQKAFGLWIFHIFIYWTHFTCLYLDPADGRWDTVWPIYLSLGKFSNLIFTLPFLTSFLKEESLSLSAAAYQTKFLLSGLQSRAVLYAYWLSSTVNDCLQQSMGVKIHFLIMIMVKHEVWGLGMVSHKINLRGHEIIKKTWMKKKQFCSS